MKEAITTDVNGLVTVPPIALIRSGWKIIAKTAPATFEQINTSYNRILTFNTCWQLGQREDVKKKKKRYFRIKKV